jgi:DNA-binding PadR family transcriptional regulator
MPGTWEVERWKTTATHAYWPVLGPAPRSTPPRRRAGGPQSQAPIISLQQRCQLGYNYVMRSTRNVVVAEKGAGMGHYSDPPLLVLASLASGPKHGHAMIEDIASICGTRLGPGTLYGAIARLEQQGWVEPLPPEERRRPYRITAEGLRVLRAKLTTLQRFIKAGVERLEPL